MPWPTMNAQLATSHQHSGQAAYDSTRGCTRRVPPLPPGEACGALSLMASTLPRRPPLQNLHDLELLQPR